MYPFSSRESLDFDSECGKQISAEICTDTVFHFIRVMLAVFVDFRTLDTALCHSCWSDFPQHFRHEIYGSFLRLTMLTVFWNQEV